METMAYKENIVYWMTQNSYEERNSIFEKLHRRWVDSDKYSSICEIFICDDVQDERLGEFPPRNGVNCAIRGDAGKETHLLPQFVHL